MKKNLSGFLLMLWCLVIVFMAITTVCGQVGYNLIQFGCMILLGIGIFFWAFRHHAKRWRIAGAVLLVCYTALLILRFSGAWTIPDTPLSDGEKVMGIPIRFFHSADLQEISLREHHPSVYDETGRRLANNT